jgi:nucleotide-binding universal stress UspA family protein
VAEGSPVERILLAAEDADMIFLGSRGLSGAKGLLMGSVSHKVANLADRTCVTVK